MPERDLHDRITVVTDKSRFPFSRGLMAHSLMRCGIGNEDAYAIAISLLHELDKSGAHEITRDALKKLVSARVEERFGSNKAEEYRNWKRGYRDIMVLDDGVEEPFSRGLLAQSLMAAGIQPEVAHSIADRTAVDISEKGISRIERSELRRITYRKINSDFGREFARHYLLWRNLKEPTKPLILLFSGATGTGKSSLSVEIAHRLGITRVIGTDTIREIMRGMFSRQLMPSIHESSYSVWRKLKKPFGDDKDPVLDAFQEQCARVKVGADAIIGRSMRENLSVIIEGVHVIPERVRGKIGDEAFVLPVLITTTDEMSHRQRFISRAQQTEGRNAGKYLKNFDNIRRIQDALIALASRRKIFTVNNVDFDETVSEIIYYLTREMGKQVGIDESGYGDD